MEAIRLTQFSRGSGCGCKISPKQLKDILKTSGAESIPELWVGSESNDDAAVMDIGNGMGLIATCDFFTPIVDDPFDFGRIAAANALSDVYAMGGKPVLALALLGWPVEKIDPALASTVIDGARSVCREATIPLAGGHSIDVPEPLFGLSVNGTIARNNIKKNNTAAEGDLLFLTKPVGSGILSAAMKRGLIEDEDSKKLISWLVKLNSIGASLGELPYITSMTDVTGFGLAGHMLEMAEGSGLTAEISYSKIPLMSGLDKYLSEKIFPDATFRNWNSYHEKIRFEKGVNVLQAFAVLPDPQTNGGLLFACSMENRKDVMQFLQENQLETFSEPIGEFAAPMEKSIIVHP